MRGGKEQAHGSSGSAAVRMFGILVLMQIAVIALFMNKIVVVQPNSSISPVRNDVPTDGGLREVAGERVREGGGVTGKEGRVEEQHEEMGEEERRVVEKAELDMTKSHRVSLDLLSRFPCPNRSFARRISFDPENRFRPVPNDVWDKVQSKNPFVCTKHHIASIKNVLVPAWRFSRSKFFFRFGGFTADMGWVLMVTRYVVTRTNKRSTGVNFFPKWGHGCDSDVDSEAGWSCFFKQITPVECLAPNTTFDFLDYKEDNVRRTVKMYDLWADDSVETTKVRNQNILNIAGLGGHVESDSDIVSMRVLFQWTFRLHESTRKMVDKVKAEVSKYLPEGAPYLAFHVRWGDKVGRGGGPKESQFIPLRQYLKALHCTYLDLGKDLPRNIYVATDDYAAITELKETLGPEFAIYTSAQPVNKGFSIDSYHKELSPKEKYRESVRLWADMEMLAGAEVLVAHMGSNIPKTVHLMRTQDPFTSVNVEAFVRTSDPKYQNCCNSMPLSLRQANCMTICA
mmetsp:Transcript_45206/g.72490  ORF Transcript_45206/g.72490 Transcript_45206/m.72490 type:complete len:512 (+) Transcript_45206:184-1719(+)